jgi:hypothetical protein
MTDQTMPASHPFRVGDLFHRDPSKRLQELRERRPPMVEDEHVGFNGKIALLITASVGTMWAAYIFTVLSLISAPAAFSSGQLLTIVSWIAQTFLQLVLLPVIIVGQNIQGRASDRRAIETYKDAEAILHECMQLQAHLEAQDRVLDDVVTRLQKALPSNT